VSVSRLVHLAGRLSMMLAISAGGELKNLGKGIKLERLEVGHVFDA